MSQTETNLWHSSEDGRYQLGDYGLHCGDCFEVFIGPEWVQTRIEHSHSSEHSHGWFIVTHPNLPLRGLMVRRAN